MNFDLHICHRHPSTQRCETKDNPTYWQYYSHRKSDIWLVNVNVCPEERSQSFRVTSDMCDGSEEWPTFGRDSEVLAEIKL